MRDERTGLITLASAFSPEETSRRLGHAVEARGMSIFARVDHAKNAADAGLSLRPTELVIFGNPRGGTALMQERQVAGIDLPLKALVWQDGEGRVWLTYDDPRGIAARHGLGAPSAKAVGGMTAALAAIADEATKDAH